MMTWGLFGSARRLCRLMQRALCAGMLPVGVTKEHTAWHPNFVATCMLPGSTSGAGVLLPIARAGGAKSATAAMASPAFSIQT